MRPANAGTRGVTNLRSLDLNLMTVFEAVFEAGSITAAADRLALSQSATSHALGRLRDACGDDLFVRLGQGIAPTPVAKRIFPEVKQALDAIRRAVAEAKGFDPATSSRRFELSLPHPVGPAWALDIRSRSAPLAPDVVLRFVTRTLPVDDAERMRAGELDLAVDWVAPEDDRFVCRKLFDDHLLLVARVAHPRVRPGVTLADLRREEFVRVHRRLGRVTEPLRELMETVANLRWRLQVSEYLEVPFLVAQSDMLGFVPRTLADRAVKDMQLQVIELPESAFPIGVNLIWHETRRTDEGHRWLRDLVAETIRGGAVARRPGRRAKAG